jgi:hypothetical protein
LDAEKWSLFTVIIVKPWRRYHWESLNGRRLGGDVSDGLYRGLLLAENQEKTP